MYIEYLEAKNKYLNAQRDYNRILDERTRLFEKTQPTAVNLDKERVDGRKVRKQLGQLLKRSRRAKHRQETGRNEEDNTRQRIYLKENRRAIKSK